MDSNSEIQGYNVYPMLYFHRKFSSSITTCTRKPPDQEEEREEKGRRTCTGSRQEGKCYEG